jgi:hypothetical protein
MVQPVNGMDIEEISEDIICKEDEISQDETISRSDVLNIVSDSDRKR